MADRLKEAVHQGDFMKIFERHEILADTTELATTLCAMVLVIHETPHFAGTQLPDVLESVRELLNSLLHSPMSSMMASALFAAVNAIRSSEIVPLKEDEALLYARGFHEKCGIGTFRKLLACGGQWRTASEGAKRALGERCLARCLGGGADGEDFAARKGELRDRWSGDGGEAWLRTAAGCGGSRRGDLHGLGSGRTPFRNGFPGFYEVSR